MNYKVWNKMFYLVVGFLVALGLVQVSSAQASDDTVLLPVITTNCLNMNAGILEIWPEESGFFRTINPMKEMCGDPLIFITALADSAPRGLLSVESLGVNGEMMISGHVDMDYYPPDVPLRVQWLAVVPQ